MENVRKSTSQALVVELDFKKLENSDNLSVTQVFGGYSYVGNTEEWKDRTKAIWLPPDTIVDTKRPEFMWLIPQAKSDGTYRVKARKIRETLSFGLMIPAPDDAVIGDDYWEKLGLEHYDPVVEAEKNNPKNKLFGGNDTSKSPPVYFVNYDLDAGRRYAKSVFIDDEPVCITEKLDGENSRYVFSDGQMYCGSHYFWKKEFSSKEHITIEKLIENGVSEDKAQLIFDKLQKEPIQRNKWWVALDRTPGLRKLCEENPDYIVYGELVGMTGGMNYGYKNGEFAIHAFDIMKDGKFLNFEDAYYMATSYGLKWTPILERNTPFNFDKVCEMAEGFSTIQEANHIREGVVVKPLIERIDPKIGRVCLKWIGAGYLEKKGKKKK